MATAHAPSRTRRRLAGRRALVITLLALLPLAYGVFLHTPPGPRSLRAFEANRMAEIEIDMWQAYYQRQKLRLFRGLVTMLREQYRYSWANAMMGAFHLARAASTFGKIQSNYERVLPDLERAYAIARDWTDGGFDPAAVARAELAWWVARRSPGQDTEERVGALLAQEYALLYEVPRERVATAALLRARAARLRDAGGARADWNAVAQILRQSYRELQLAVRSAERVGGARGPAARQRTEVYRFAGQSPATWRMEVAWISGRSSR